MEKTTKLLFLGTAAADFTERLETDCKYRFDMDERRASCMLMGEKYLIDCGMHALDSIAIAKVDTSKITDVFITHLHEDHFVAEHVAEIAKGKKNPLRVWVRRDAVLPEIPNAEIIYMPRHKAIPVDEDLTVEAIDANHDPVVFPQHFIFTIHGKQLLYALDGGWFLNESYRYMRKRNLDFLVLDATSGDYLGDYRMGEHNSIPMIRLILPSFKTYGVIHDKTRVYLSHLAPSLHKPHAETVELVAKDGLQVAYDGLAVEL